jgi:hypothetical protein
MEPITVFCVYFTVSVISFGMIYFHQETQANQIYKNL